MNRGFNAAWLVTAAVTAPLVVAAPAFAQGLSLVDAARSALVDQPTVRLANERLLASRGDLRAVEGIFDVQVTSGFTQVRSVTANTTFEQQFQGLRPNSTAHLSTLAGGFSKLLPGGQLVAPSVQLERTDVGAVPPAANRATVSVFLSQPLLRGRGRDIVTAPVTSARLQVEASRLDVRHLKSASVLSTAISYWTYVAAVQRLDVFTQSEARAREIYSQTQVLIQAGNRPAVDLNQVQANLASRITQRLSGEQSVYEARQALGIAMGIPYERIDALPLPSDAFPTVPSALPSLDGLLALALQKRADLQGSRRRQASAATELHVAEDNVRANLDVQLNLGYSGLDEGSNVFRYLSPLGTRMTGPQVTLGVAWEVFPANNQALGRLARSRSQLTEAQIETAELGRSLKSNVAVARDNVQRSAERLENAREASRLYQTAVEDQRDMQQLGLSTVIDLITTEDRLTATQLDELTALLNLAIAIAQLRYETGTLLTAEDDVDATSLTTPPAVAPGS